MPNAETVDSTDLLR